MSAPILSQSDAMPQSTSTPGIVSRCVYLIRIGLHLLRDLGFQILHLPAEKLIQLIIAF